MTMTREEIKGQVGSYVMDYFHTGSNYICNPPVNDTDIDYMVLLEPQKLGVAKLVLYGNSWEYCGKDYAEDDHSDFSAFRKGKYNLIITEKDLYFNLFKDATELAKKLNLRDKQQRIDLFKYVIEGEI